MPIYIPDATLAMRDAMEESFGFIAYDKTLTLREVNVATDVAYQKNYTSFYRIRRDAAWLRAYYQYMEDHKCDATLTMTDVLSYLYTVPHKAKGDREICSIELSFASKMLATMMPHQYPIWDSRVVKAMGLEAGFQSLQEAIDAYEAFRQEIQAFIATDDGVACLGLFDQMFPRYTHVSLLKKMDVYLWHMGK